MAVRRRRVRLDEAIGAAAVLALAVSVLLLEHTPPDPGAGAARTGTALGRDAAGAGGLSFERNVGQADRRVRFLARSPGGTVYLTGHEAVLVLSRSPGGSAEVLRMDLANAARAPVVSPADPLPGTANYLIGAAGRHTRVPTYAAVVYHSVYPGIDLRYHGALGQLEYDFELRAGADPSRIALDLTGARRLRVDRAGNLRVALADRTLVHRRPRIYQDLDGRRQAIGGGYVLLGAGRVGFALAAHDRSRPVVIDPTIVYSGQLVGSAPGAGRAIAVDRAGSSYVTGETSSASFATARPLEAHPRGAGVTAFVTKIDAAGVVVYSTYLGGSRYTAGRGIAVDGAGDAYVTGATSSTDFPTTRSAVQRSYGGGPFDAFVTRLNASGTALAYSTFLGDTHYDEGNAIAVDARGRAAVTGRTVSPQFPVAGALAPHVPSGVFVTKLDHAGTRLVSSTVLGGGPADHGDTGFAIAEDPQGSIYVTGVTNAADFPTVRALQRALGGRADAFVIKIDATSSRVVYSTFLGGTGDEVGRAIAADGDGNAYVTGLTTSHDLPTASPLQAANASRGSAAADAFVVKIDPAGGLVFATYLGGAGQDGGSGIAVDRSRNVYVTGSSASPDFPLVRLTQPALRGSRDAFLSELDRSGSSLVFSTFLGGSAEDAGLAVAVDRAGAVHLTGQSSSRDFPRRGSHPRGPGRYDSPGDSAFLTTIRTAGR